MSRLSDEGFRSLVENAEVAIATSDLKGRFTYVNQALANLLGYSVEDLVGRPFTEFLHPDDRGRITRLFLKIILLRREPRNVEFRILRKDGRVLYLMSKPTRFIVNSKTVGFQAIIMDITVRKEIEKCLYETNRKLETLFETAIEGITVVDATENLTFVNKAFADIIGYKEDELIGQNLKKFLDEKGIQEIKRQTDTRKRGTVSRYEITLHRKDSKPRIVQVSASPIWNEDGSFGGSISIVMDITERKQIQEKLVESEERLRQLIEYAPDAIYMNDLEGNFIDGNKQAEKLIGYKKEELAGKNIFNAGIISKRYVPIVLEMMQKTVNEEKVGPREVELIRKDGTAVTAEVSAFPVKRGGKVEVFGIARDITERMKAMSALKESEEKFRSLFEKANDGLVFINQSGKILDINQKAIELAGIRKEEILGKSFMRLGLVGLKDIPMLLRRLQNTIQGEPTTGFEISIKRKDGKIIFLEVNSTLIRKGHLPIGSLAIVRDVTERKRMLAKLEEYSQQLEEIVEKRTRQLKEAQEKLVRNERLATIGQVSSMVGHDLRNPLTGISGATYYLRRKLTSNLDKTSREMLELIETNVEYSNKIVNDLLEYSRGIKLEPAKTTPKSITEESLSSIKIPANIQVLNYTTDETHVRVDVQKMKRVFLNIINNAFDAMPNGGKLKIYDARRDGNLQIAFSDNGFGISKDVLEKVWMPFFTTKAKGMGLGLAICKRIVEAHGGSIVIDSTVGKGTTLTVTFPIEPKIKEEGGEEVWISKPEYSLSTTTKAYEKS